MIVSDLAAGIAAEHLVCADLILAGHKAFMTDQTCAYDVTVDAAGTLIRVQVKATRGQRAIQSIVTHTPAYMWFVRRAGKAGTRKYEAGEFDILALVALDIRQIAYLPPSLSKNTIHIRPPGAVGGKQFPDLTFDRAMLEVRACQL